MEQIACKECTSPDCHGCNIFRLSRMLKDGKLDALMDENRGIKVEMQARPAMRSKWIKMKFFPDWECEKCGSVVSGNTPDPWNHYHYCPNCGADMRIFSTNYKNTVTTGEDREISNLRAWLKNGQENKTK